MTWSFFRVSDGTVLPGVFSGPERFLKANTPPDCEAIKGAHDPKNRRVNLKTRDVEPYQPSAPDEDHEWNADLELWVLNPDVVAIRSRKAAALARIQDLESKQLRAVRELSLDATDAIAQKKLRDIDDEIALLRKDL